MRRYLAVLLSLALSPFGLFAKNTLTIHQKDGQQFSFGFEEKPVVSFTENALAIKSTKVEVQYELAKVAKFTFDDLEDAVIGIKDDVTNASITLSEYTVCISGAKAGIVVNLIASNGRTLQQYKTDADGSVSFCIAELPEGTYVISSQSLTCKILKK